MITAKEISARLAAECRSVCARLLPHGKIEGGNWCVGSTSGEKGKSLRVQLSGSKTGIWADFSSGADEDRGDLLDLWRAVRGCTPGRAISEAKEFLRINDPWTQSVPHKKYVVPKFPESSIKLKDTPGTDVEKYLTEKRLLALETLQKFRIGQYDHPTIGRSVAYPYQSPEGKWIAVKWISLARDEDGKKKIKSPPEGQAPSLWGWQAFPKESRTVLICEGQIDAMTWYQWGLPVLSIPNGLGDPTWIDYEWENLCQFDSILLAYDMDPPGRKEVIKIAHRLGTHRCMIVNLPYNDANECLQKGCTGADAARWTMEAKHLTPEEIKTPWDFRDQILARQNPDPNQKIPGLGIPELGRTFRFLPGEVTIWTGYSTHGKSSFLNQVALYAAMADEGVAIGSFEMRGDVLCEKLAKCLSFKSELSEPILDQCLQWMSGKIWIYNILGIVTEVKLLELMLYSVMRHGIKHVIIDSLMKCDLSSEDYEAQRKFLNKFIGFCEEHDIHGHIVAHPKKSEDGASAPDIMDIHGGQSVSAQPNNIICVWRNLKKADKHDSQMTKEKYDAINDGGIYIRKDRTTGLRVSQPLWYVKARERFTCHSEDTKPYYPDFKIIKEL